MYTYRRAGPGYWVTLLFPVALILNQFYLNSSSSSPIKFKGPLAILIINTGFLYLIQRLGYDLEKLLKKIVGINVLLVAFIAISWNVNSRTESFYELCGYITLGFLSPFVFNSLVSNSPGSFSFGEAVLTTQAFLMSFWASVSILPFPPTHGLFSLPEVIVLRYVTPLGFLSSIVLGRVIVLTHSPWKFYFTEELFTLWAKSCVVCFLAYRLTPDDLFGLYEWAMNFFFASVQRKVILSYWAGLLALSVGVVCWKSWKGATTSIERKYFHFLIVAAYLPGILKDFNLVYLSSAAIMCIFLLIEITRAIKFTIFGRFAIGEGIDDYVSVFRDSQDEGPLILTPIYLLAGCSLPLWLMGPRNELNEFEIAVALSGITSIGIGDTFASICGSTFGKHKWKDSIKTIEGTIFSIISQLIFISILHLSGFCPFSLLTTSCIFTSILINALVEAKTDQIDNIVLPLLTFNLIYGMKLLADL